MVEGKNNVGGYIGYGYDVTINGGSNSNSISGMSYVGGIAGYNTGSFYDCMNSGTVKALGHHAGGIAGFSGYLSKCTNSGSISAKGLTDSGGLYLGGLAGRSAHTNDCSNTGLISTVVSGNYVGGIAGFAYMSGNSSYVSNTTDIVSNGDYVGGLFGYADNDGGGNWTISNSSNTGLVRSSGDYVGGLIGFVDYYNSSYSDSYDRFITIISCNNVGNVGGNSYVGGYIGFGYSTLKYLEFIETVTGYDNVHAIGKTTGQYIDCDGTRARVVVKQ